MYDVENMLCEEKVSGCRSGQDGSLDVCSAGLHSNLAQAAPLVAGGNRESRGPLPLWASKAEYQNSSDADEVCKLAPPFSYLLIDPQ